MEHRRDPDYVRARGILEDVDLFDADFFRMSPREADVTDPQQRVFLETAWEALERAGYDPETYDGAIGVYAGMSNNTYFLANLYHRPDILEQSGELPMLGNEKDYLATRVSYKLDLRGPSINVVTACSSSLVAVCQAVQALETHQCDMALAGGVSIGLPQKRGYLYQEGFITSPDGHCRAFDEHAAGTVFSNGLGIVVLKRLEDALDRRGRRSSPSSRASASPTTDPAGSASRRRAWTARPTRSRWRRRSPESIPTRSGTSRRTARERRWAIRSRSRVSRRPSASSPTRPATARSAP